MRWVVGVVLIGFAVFYYCMKPPNEYEVIFSDANVSLVVKDRHGSLLMKSVSKTSTQIVKGENVTFIKVNEVNLLKEITQKHLNNEVVLVLDEGDPVTIRVVNVIHDGLITLRNIAALESGDEPNDNSLDSQMQKVFDDVDKKGRNYPYFPSIR